MAKIAAELEQRGDVGHAASRVVASGDGWTVDDVVCTSGPRDQPFEERHSRFRIAVVTAGTFQYRADIGSELMTPGSLFLGNEGQSFECGHEHGTGDRCLSFGYTPGYFERIAADAGVSGRRLNFSTLRLPPLRPLSPLVALACAGLAGSGSTAWEEIGIQLAAQAVQLAHGLSSSASAPPNAVARVTRVVRRIEHVGSTQLTLKDLAEEARLSPYHFLRVFVGLTGLTPHQYLLRMRLRAAALRLTAEQSKILDIALDSGFGDVSNFNRAFRNEFGVSPRAYRRRY